MSEALFPMDHEPIEEVEKLSPDRARTIKQARLIAAGKHPLAYMHVLRHPRTFGQDYVRDDKRGREFTCGSCVFRTKGGYHSWPKCMAGDGIRASGGASSDVRAFWPACREWEAAQ